MKNLTMKEALKAHWPEYVMEAAELGAFMVSACVFTAIIWHPASPIRQSIQNPLLPQAPPDAAPAASPHTLSLWPDVGLAPVSTAMPEPQPVARAF